MKPFILMIVSMTFYCAAFAEGGVGNSGDVMFTEDGRAKLADPYMVTNGEAPRQRTKNLRPELLSRIEHMGRILTMFGADASYTNPKDEPASTLLRPLKKSLFLVDTVLADRVEYYWEQNLPDLRQCQNRLNYNPPKNVVRIARAGCTVGNTFLVKPIVDAMAPKPGDSPEEQLAAWDEMAALIIHERLHDIALQPTYEHIASITSGLLVATQHDRAQQSGQQTTLSSEDIQSLRRMVDSIKALQLSTSTDNVFTGKYSIHKNGGAIIHPEAEVSEKAYLGFGQYIQAGSVIDSDVEMMGSNICAFPCKLENVEIKNSGFKAERQLKKKRKSPFITIGGKGKKTRIKDFILQEPLETSSLIGSGVFIENVQSHSQQFYISNNVVWRKYHENSYVLTEPYQHHSRPIILFSENVVVENVSTIAAHRIFIDENSTVKNVESMIDSSLLGGKWCHRQSEALKTAEYLEYDRLNHINNACMTENIFNESHMFLVLRNTNIDGLTLLNSRFLYPSGSEIKDVYLESNSNSWYFVHLNSVLNQNKQDLLSEEEKPSYPEMTVKEFNLFSDSSVPGGKLTMTNVNLRNTGILTDVSEKDIHISNVELSALDAIRPISLRAKGGVTLKNLTGQLIVKRKYRDSVRSRGLRLVLAEDTVFDFQGEDICPSGQGINLSGNFIDTSKVVAGGMLMIGSGGFSLLLHDPTEYKKNISSPEKLKKRCKNI